MSSDPAEALDPERRLALLYVSAARREPLAALWALDAALGALLARGREPIVTQIKLAWWRDALTALDRETAPPEPLLQTVADVILPRGVAGSQLAELTARWEHLLGSEPLTEAEAEGYAGRGGLLFRYSAMLLDQPPAPEVERAGEAWALVDLARRSSREADAELALRCARRRGIATRWPGSLRPIGMLAMLARHDAQGDTAQLGRQGSPGRLLRMLGHRLTGR